LSVNAFLLIRVAVTAEPDSETLERVQTSYEVWSALSISITPRELIDLAFLAIDYFSLFVVQNFSSVFALRFCDRCGSGMYGATVSVDNNPTAISSRRVEASNVLPRPQVVVVQSGIKSSGLAHHQCDEQKDKT